MISMMLTTVVTAGAKSGARYEMFAPDHIVVESDFFRTKCSVAPCSVGSDDLKRRISPNRFFSML
jgi:hypothetical protein